MADSPQKDRIERLGGPNDTPHPEGQARSGPPTVPRGGSIFSIPQAFIRRAIDGAKDLVYRRAADAAASVPPSTRPTASSQVVPHDPTTTDGWMPPGKPQNPITEQWENVAGRAFDYPAGYNNASQVRQWEGLSLQALRNLAENCDLLRLAIETRKDQLSKLKWSIMPVKPADGVRPKADDRCRAIEKAMRRPDGVHTWDQWIRMVAEDSFVLDGVALFRRRTPEGKPFALETVDPTTIMPLIDITGRSPLPPHAAYSQVLKGGIAAQYTRNEMTYWIRNPRSHRVYGYSQVEQIVRTVMVALGRASKQIGHYSEGNIPDMLLSTPANWTAQQIQEFQTIFDRMMMVPGSKRRAHFVPPGVGQPVLINSEQHLFGPFDEWLARVICYAFSLPPFPFVKETNRSTAEASYDAALSEGLGPFITSLKAMLDIEIEEFFGGEGLELVWDDERKLDPTEQSAKDQADLQSALASIDDVRAERGKEPLGIGPLIWGIGPMGFVTPEQLQQIIQSGANMPPPPMAMDAMAGKDPLANASPELLAELGIEPPGQGVSPGEAGAGAGMGTSAGPAQLVAPTRGDMIAVSRARPVPEARALIAEIEGKLSNGRGMPAGRTPMGREAPGEGRRAPAHGMRPMRDARGGGEGEGKGGLRRGVGGAARRAPPPDRG